MLKVYAFILKLESIPILRFIGIGILIFFISTKYFYLVIIFLIWYFYFNWKNTTKYTISENHLVVKNLLSSTQYELTDFHSAYITLANVESMGTIILKNRDGSNIAYVPTNKSDAVRVVRIVEKIGIQFTKNKAYNLLMEWAKKPHGEDGAWY